MKRKQKQKLNNNNSVETPKSEFLALLWTLRELKMISYSDTIQIQNSKALIELLEEKKYITRKDLDKNRALVLNTLTVLMEARERKSTGKILHRFLSNNLGHYYTSERLRDMTESIGNLNVNS